MNEVGVRITPAIGSRELVQTLLINAKLIREVRPEKTKEDKPKFSYDASIDSIDAGESHTFAFATMKVDKIIGEVSVVQFSALYLFGFFGAPFEDLEGRNATLDHLLSNIVWPRFRDLCEITITQAEVDFPRLPNQPDEVHHRYEAESQS